MWLIMHYAGFIKLRVIYHYYYYIIIIIIIIIKRQIAQGLFKKLRGRRGVNRLSDCNNRHNANRKKTSAVIRNEHSTFH